MFNLTLDKIKKFVAIRNKSEFISNLQFEIDAHSVGLKVADLGKIQKCTTARGLDYYRWPLPNLPVRLIEARNAMGLVNKDCSLEFEEDEVHRLTRY